MAEVKLLAPTAFRKTLERAITADDYARLAERTGGVQRAAAGLAWTGSWYEADVAVDALGRETPDKKLLAEVTGSLRRYRRIGHDLAVMPARRVPLAITLEVCVLPGFLRGHVKAALLAIFGNRVLPDGRLGIFHPDNLTFGEGMYLSKLVATAQAVPGVESVRVTRLQRLFEDPNGELENGLLPLGPDEIAQLDDDPDFPEHGQLELVMKGGR
jgi:predicted phage baseplate assembly protein